MGQGWVGVAHHWPGDCRIHDAGARPVPTTGQAATNRASSDPEPREKRRKSPRAALAAGNRFSIMFSDHPNA